MMPFKLSNYQNPPSKISKFRMNFVKNTYVLHWGLICRIYKGEFHYFNFEWDYNRYNWGTFCYVWKYIPARYRVMRRFGPRRLHFHRPISLRVTMRHIFLCDCNQFYLVKKLTFTDEIFDSKIPRPKNQKFVISATKNIFDEVF